MAQQMANDGKQVGIGQPNKMDAANEYMYSTETA